MARTLWAVVPTVGGVIGRGLRVAEVDAGRDLVGRDPRPQVVDQFDGCQEGTSPRHDERHRDLALIGIRRGDHGRDRHVRVLLQR